MHFIDEAQIDVSGGAGGNGCVAFRREKFVPLGGPSGGDGGKGGDVVFVAHSGLSTLYDLTVRREIRAARGEDGRNKDQYGKSGEDVTVRVPVGTQIFDETTGELIVDLDQPDKTFVVARGGKGGRGNIHFATPYDRAPRRAEPGEPGQTRRIRLELKLMADVGIVGFPNVGKSTLIAALSRARPKIADYPFTTLTPNLGVATLGGQERAIVIADIPGIIEGASEGAGLGLRFLKHVQRCKALLHVITIDADPKRDPLRDFDVLMEEMRRFEPALLTRPMLVGLSKIDLPEVRERRAELNEVFDKRGLPFFAFSAATREGLDELLRALYAVLA